MNPCVAIVSTYTDDVVKDAVSGTERAMPGGPALYISLALGRLGVTYRVVTGQRARVEVLPAAEGEQYVIPALDTITLPSTFREDAVILSPIMREISLEVLPPVAGLLVVDLQGFVREASRPSAEVDTHFELAPLLSRANIVKASDHELMLLTPRSHAALSEATLITTRGSRGATIRAPDGEYFIPAHPIAAAQTVGAGDTFLAAFVCHTLHGHNAADAGEYAARFTEEFLLRRDLPV